MSRYLFHRVVLGVTIGVFVGLGWLGVKWGYTEFMDYRYWKDKTTLEGQLDEIDRIKERVGKSRRLLDSNHFYKMETHILCGSEPPKEDEPRTINIELPGMGPNTTVKIKFSSLCRALVKEFGLAEHTNMEESP